MLSSEFLKFLFCAVAFDKHIVGETLVLLEKGNVCASFRDERYGCYFSFCRAEVAYEFLIGFRIYVKSCACSGNAPETKQNA